MNYDEIRHAHIVPDRRRLDDNEADFITYVVGLEPVRRTADVTAERAYMEPTPVGPHA